MRFGIHVPQFGDYGDPNKLAAFAREAEDSGWDGFFIWDHIQVNWPAPVADTTVALAAIALATRRMRIGPIVTPLFRRNPVKLARETVSLDHLSGGRLVLGVGLGGDWFGEISTFAGPLEGRVRAAMLDEALAVIIGLWSGAKFSFDGDHYQVREAQFIPAPLQLPRIPIWLAGTWPKKPPFRRAARFDGIVPASADIEKVLSPDDIRGVRDFIEANRSVASPFDIVCTGETSGDPALAREKVAPYAEAGATWWLEGRLPWKESLDDFRRRVLAGPPVLA